MMRILSKTSLCSSLAIATACIVGASPAAAQVAGILNNDGGATVTGGGASVILNGPQTTIDWTATGTVTNGVNNFLPSGNTMAFSGASDYAVLNRVTTAGSDLLGLNGTITSTVNGAKGGHVFFYNPNGIVVGGSAVIDVGSLGLTTAPLHGADTNQWFTTFNTAAPSLQFDAANANSQIRIESGAGSIKSNGTNSYIAVVAPKITTSGTIKTDGDVALVAAEAATLSFSSQYDLYSIQVDIGTTAGDSLTVNGGSIGRNSLTETSGIARNAYLVTVPKNDATTLLITGGASLGFDVANSVTVEGNSIVLSAGRDLSIIGNAVPDGNIAIDRSTFSSDVDAYATQRVSVGPNGGTTHFLNNVDLESGWYIGLGTAGGDILIDGDLYANASTFGAPDNDATGGWISLSAANGHSLTISGDTELHADGEGGYRFESGLTGTNGTGGLVSISASNATLNLANLEATANGQGGVAAGSATGGKGQGGTIEVIASDGGSISADYALLRAHGEGGSTIECSSCGITGGEGRGGSVAIKALGTDSGITFGESEATAYGFGGAGDVRGGAGIGGNLSVVLSGLSAMDLGYFAQFYADGGGGYGIDDGVGGNGFGGSATLQMDAEGGDRPDLTSGYFFISADGVGGYSGFGNSGGMGQGGLVTATINDGNFTATSALFASSGVGGASYADRAGDSRGGTTTVSLNGASVNVDERLMIDASAVDPNGEGDSALGNLAVGGTATLSATNSNIVVNAGNEYPSQSLLIRASANGANGASGDGGDAVGGTINATFSGSTVLGSEMLFDAHALGGVGYAGTGGDASGGQVHVHLVNATVNASPMTLTGNATAGTGTDGGGTAIGNMVDLSTSQSALYVNGVLTLDGKAIGGAGTGEESGGGSATGANVSALFDDSLVTTTGRIDISSEGLGGASNGSYDGGDGTGGTASLAATGGSTVSTNNTWVISYGTGGAANCSACDASGGDGVGGTGSITLAGNGTTFGVNNTLQLYTSGNGGNGTGDASGGNGWASPATLTVGGGTTLNVKNAFVFADGVGGNAEGTGNGGDGHASTAALLGDDVAGGAINQTGGTFFHITAEGFTGNPSTGVGGAVDGDAGSAYGGEAVVRANGLQFNGNALWVSAYASAGDSLTSAGGNAVGGNASVLLYNGAQFNVAQSVTLNSYANAGDGASGGYATAGNADLSLDNASMVTGTALAADAYSVVLASYAFGGSGSEGDGGAASTGTAALYAMNGSSLSAKSLHVSTGAMGGNSDGGATAGNADAGISFVSAQGGSNLTVAGSAKILALAVGGIGSGGADGGTASADALALLNSVGGSSVSIVGDLEINTDRTGGAGHNGGDALAIINYQTPTVGETYPVSEILANGGSVSVGGVTTLTSNAIGGHGEYGGNGGDAFGGTASIRAVNGAAGPSAVTLGDLTMTTTSTAGNGGDGASSEVGDGGNGGNGGDVLAGMIFIQAMSLNGQVAAGNLTLSTTSQAGNGGWGGSGINGGNGGQGGSVIGNWSAGAINLSLPSGGNPPGLPLVTNGFQHFGDIVADTSATGGNGGWGGWATDGANGTAGNGGSAQSGDLYIINRGGDQSAGDLSWTFDATGGHAGSNPNESAAGVGGDASTGQFLLLNTNRTGQVDQRGTMTFGDIFAVGASTGGYGLVDGHSYHASNLDFETINSDTHLGSLTFAVDANDGPVIDTYDFTSQVTVDNGTVVIDGGLTLDLPESLAVWLNNGTLTASAIDLSAGNFVPRPIVPAPTNLGTISAGAMSVVTGNDIRIDANLDIGGGLSLDAPGSIAIGSATTGDGSLSLTAQGGLILTSALSAAGNVDLTAAGDISTLGIDADGSVSIDGAAINTGAIAAYDIAFYGSSLTTGSLDAWGGGIQAVILGPVSTAAASAAGTIDIYADGPLSMASASAGGDLYLEAAAGNLTLGGYSLAYGDIDLAATGLVQTADLDAEGGISIVGGAIDVGNLHAGANLGGGIGTFGFVPGNDIGLWSGSTVDAGNLTAEGSIGIAAPGNIAVGGVNAGALVMMLGGGTIMTGPISAGDELYIGGYGMFALGYDPQTEDFDPNPVLALAPTATGGSVVVDGDVSATLVRANAGASLAMGAVTSTAGDTWLRASGNLTTGNIGSAGAVDVRTVGTSGSTSVGTVDAVGSIYVRGAQNATAGAAASATGGYTLWADTGLATGGGATAALGAGVLGRTGVNITGNMVAGREIGIDSGGNATFQSVTSGGAGQYIDIRADGNVSFTNVNGATPTWIAAGGNVNGGNVTGVGHALVMAGGTVNLSSLSATGNASNAAIAHYDAYFDAVNLGGFDAPSFLDAMHLAGPAGAVTVGNINAQTVFADTASLSVANLTANSADLTATGLASVNGAWNVPFLYLTSGDINVANNASITSSSVDLHSTNSVGAAIGDNSGAAQGSYVLSNAEFGRIHADHLIVLARMNASPIDLLIGNLALAGGSGQYYDLGVVNPNGDYAYDGRLRVVGKITGQNFVDGDRLDLDAQLMEIEAVNGGIDFSPNSDATVGTLAFFGQRVHIAEASVLDKLAADTQYAGRDLDLATAPTAAHSATTVNVGTVNLHLFEPGGFGGLAAPAAVPTYSIYAQNMGSTNARSGLLIADANINSQVPAGSVEMIINGKLVDPESGAVLEGGAVRDAFVSDPENDLTLFTASSSINGCALTGGNCFTPPPPPPPPQPKVEDLANQFVFLDSSIGDQLGFGDDAGSGDDGSDEDEGDKTEEKNAIDPPPPVINGKPIDPQTPTDEPVSGSGNPALIGTGSSQQEQQ